MNTHAHSRFLDLRALAALEHMRFATRHRIEGSFSGCHTSRQQGGRACSSTSASTPAAKTCGRLDWKVLGRTGKAFVRIHEEETNLLCTLALDASGSMRFGGRQRDARPSKLEYAQYLATALAHVISRGQDQVGLAVLDQRLRETLPPGATASHVELIYTVIEELVTRPTTHMAAGLRELFERSRPPRASSC